MAKKQKMNTEEMSPEDTVDAVDAVDAVVEDGANGAQVAETLMNMLGRVIGDDEDSDGPGLEFEIDMSPDIAELSQDPDWESTLLAELRPEEQIDGNPRMCGLRRLTEKYVGTIFETKSRVVQAPTPMTETATVTVSVTAGNYKASGTADAIKSDFKDRKFGMHLSAIAETRALSRAFRQLLRMNKVSADEIQGLKTSTDMEEEANGRINENQVRFIDRYCQNSDRGYDINVRELFKHVLNLEEFPGLAHLSEDEAKEVIRFIQEDVQRKKKKVVDELVGYDSGWKIN